MKSKTDWNQTYDKKIEFSGKIKLYYYIKVCRFFKSSVYICARALTCNTSVLVTCKYVSNFISLIIRARALYVI